MAKKKYLSVKLAGHDYVAAFKNEKKTEDKHPDFKGDGIAVWIKEYDDTPKPKKEPIVQDMNDLLNL